MPRVRPLLAASLALVAIATVGATPLRHNREIKSLLVTVLDQNNEPLRDLKAREFLVSEDGTQREVISARLIDDPLYVALLVDTARPVPGAQYPIQELRRGLSAFSRRVLSGTEGSEIVIFDIAVAGSIMVPYSSRFDPLNAWIKRLAPSPQATGVLLETLVEAARDLMPKPSPRRAIVSVTFDSPESSAVPPNVVADVVLKAGAAYWPVSVRGTALGAANLGLHSDKALSPLREALFSSLPDQSGGMRVSAVTALALESLLKKVAEALTAQYEVIYARPDGVGAKTIDAGARRGAKVLRAVWIR